MLELQIRIIVSGLLVFVFEDEGALRASWTRQGWHRESRHEVQIGEEDGTCWVCKELCADRHTAWPLVGEAHSPPIVLEKGRGACLVEEVKGFFAYSCSFL